MLLNESISTLLYDLLLVVGGIASIVNLNRAINRPAKTDFERIIKEQEDIITSLERKIKTYQILIDDNRSKLE